MPAHQAKAGFFADLFGVGESASAENTSSVPTENLQNIALLETSSISPAEEDTDINVLSENALLPATSAMGVDSEEADITADQIEVYVVKKGDTIPGIAKMFNVSPNTIVWANSLKSGEKLIEGDTLIILPVSGVKHIVLKGQTLKIIAKKYGVEVSDITSFNNISIDTELMPGDELVIPGAEIAVAPAPKTTKKAGLPASSSGSSKSAGYFIKPIDCRLSQGKHDRYAVDLACGAGKTQGLPIKAAASGKVIFAKYGWNGAFGNLTIIQHPNGMQTYYAHQSSLNVTLGQQVNQGDVIGYVGSTGRSTGPHLHFEVRGGYNPGFNNSWKQ